MSVGRDQATVASDPNNDRFNTVLSKDQINALPDDPDEMESVLKEMAGPGATIRVDGFRGGKLPPKSQIRSIRFSRDMSTRPRTTAAGMVFVDIVTQPGLGPLRGSLDFLFRDDSLNARNAFQPEKGPEQTQQYTFNLSGTLRKERTSFSLSAAGASLYDSANVFAARSAGVRTDAVRRPSDRINFNGRVDHALTKAHTLRANCQQNSNGQRQPRGRRLRPARPRVLADARDDSLLRLSESGPWRRSVFAESRLQLRRQSTALVVLVESCRPSACSTPSPPAARSRQADGQPPTWSGPPTSTGRGGSTRSASARWSKADWFRSDSRTNYLGTYTFASLADYDAGRPATYTQRDRRSARRVLAVAGGPVHSGRLARAQEPHGQRRPAPGAPDPPRRRMEPGAARRAHLVAVQERQDDHARRRRDLLRLARRRTRTSRRCASTASASRTW